MTRRWPGSSSGSRSTRRRAASIAPDGSPRSLRAAASRSRRSPTMRSTRAARAACQSSKSGLSRSAKPARNGPRARAAAASRSRLDRTRPGARARAGPPTSCRDRRPPAPGRSSMPTGPTARPQRRQRPAEGAAGRLVVGVGPEHRGQFVARERPPLGGDERDDRERLAGIDGDRAAADDDLERPEEVDPERGHRRHRVTVPRTAHIP